MAESATMGMELDEQLVDTEEDHRDENARTIFLAELNLIQIISYLSLSSEELDFEAVEINENAKPQQEHKVVSDLRSRKRGGIKKYKNIEPEIQRFSTKIRDCRHSRRM